MAIVSTMAVTTALATTSATKEVYGQSYAYSGKLGNNSYVSWNIKGDSSTAMTTAGKTESKFQRYIKVSVECRNTANNAVISNQTNKKMPEQVLELKETRIIHMFIISIV